MSSIEGETLSEKMERAIREKVNADDTVGIDAVKCMVEGTCDGCWCGAYTFLSFLFVYKQ